MLAEYSVTVRDTPLRIVHPASAPMTFVLEEVFERQAYPYLSFLEPVQTILDVGAHVGCATLFFAACYPTARVFAFEPCGSAFSVLRDNTAPFPRISVFPFGLFDADEPRWLYHGRESSVTNSLGCSPHNGSTGEQIDLRRASAVFDSLQIAGSAVLKLDTEGAEVAILADLGERIALLDAVMLEYHCDADRRRVDQLMGRTHLLHSCSARRPHRGTLTYVAHRAVESRTSFNELAITMVTKGSHRHNA